MSYIVRPLVRGECEILHSLARQCPPLDVHTPYTYWVVSEFFSDGCFILESDGTPVGYIMSLLRDRLLFLWQIGVAPDHQGKGCSALLYAALGEYAKSSGATELTTTITDSNAASRAAMESFCRRRGFQPQAVGTVSISDDADPAFHEVETRYRISLQSTDAG